MLQFDAIVYTSQHGHTGRYAEILGEMTAKPVLPLEEANISLAQGSRILYLGWLHASRIMGYRKAASRFAIAAACGVGLCDTGTLLAEVRRATAIPDEIPLFTLQGGMDRSRLRGMDRLLISMLTRAMETKKQRTEQDERMLVLLKSDADLVRRENLQALLEAISEP